MSDSFSLVRAGLIAAYAQETIPAHLTTLI